MIGPCQILLCLMFAGQPAAARISTIDGATIEGQITSIEPDSIHYRMPQRDAVLPLTDIDRIDSNVAPALPRIPKQGPICTLYFPDGGLLEGQILPPNKESDKGLRIDIGLGQPYVIRLEAIAAIRFGRADHPAAEAEFENRRSHRASGRDLLVVPQGAQAVVLPGALESLGPRQWTFRFGDKLQSAALEKAFGVVLGGVAPPHSERSQMFHLAGRNRIAGQIRSADASTLQVDGGPLGEISLPWDSIAAIAFRSDRVVYLSDLEPSTTKQSSLFNVSWPPRRDANVTGGPMNLSGRTYSKGLGVHAYSAITYKLDGGFERFTATIGIDDNAAGGSAVFRVRGDDRVLYESKLLTAQVSQAVALDVRGIHELTLECDAGPDLDLADHCDWAEARLIRATSNRTH